MCSYWPQFLACPLMVAQKYAAFWKITFIVSQDMLSYLDLVVSECISYYETGSWVPIASLLYRLVTNDMLISYAICDDILLRKYHHKSGNDRLTPIKSCTWVCSL